MAGESNAAAPAPTRAGESRIYDLFISYSRADTAFTAALEKALEAYRPPKASEIPQRRLRVFRDQDDLIGADYYRSIDKYIQSSAKMLLVCSPAAAKSPYVNDEVKRFLAAHTSDDIIAVLLDGLPNNEAKQDQADQCAFPPALCETLAMPLAIGYRGIKAPKQKPHRSPFDGSWHSILASAYGVSREELEQREKVRQRQRRNTIASITAAVMIALVGLTIYAFWQRSVAIDQRNRALRGQSLFLAQLASEQTQSGNTGNAVLLSLEALPKKMNAPERPYVPEAESQLYDAILNHRELRVLSGHTDRVTFAEFSPDAKTILSASHDGTARLWDANTGSLKVVLAGHGRRVTHGAFSPDGNTIVTAAADGSVGVWRAANGARLRLMKEHTDAVWHISFTRDGSRFVTSSRDGTARVWSTGGGEPPLVLTVKADYPIGNAEISSDGQFVAVGNRGDGADIFNAHTGQLLVHLQHPRGLYSLAFHSNSSILLTACADNTARLWSVPTGTPLGTLAGHTDRVFHAAFSPDGETILTTSADRTARLWNAHTRSSILTLQGHTDEVRHGAFSPDGKQVVTSSRDDTARLWNAGTGAQIATLAGHTADVTNAEFSPDGNRIVTTGDQTARVWSVGRNGRVLELQHPGSVGMAAFSSDGKRLLTSSSGWVELAGGRAGLWDARSGASIAPLKHARDVTSASFDHLDRRILTTSRDGASRIWDAHTGTLLLELPRQRYEVNFGAFSPDDRFVAVAATDVYKGGVLGLFDSATGKLLAQVPSNAKIFSLEFSADGKRLVSWGNGGTIIWSVTPERLELLKALPQTAPLALSGDGKLLATRGKPVNLFNLQTGAQMLRVSVPDVAVSGAFSPDSKLLALGGRDGVVRLWQLEPRKELRRMEGHRDVINDIHFSKDGKLLVTSAGEMEVTNNTLSYKTANSKDNSARVWDVLTGKEIAVLRGHTTRVRFADFSADRTRVVTTSDDRTARVWDLYPSTQALIDEGRRLVPRDLTPDQRRMFFLE